MNASIYILLNFYLSSTFTRLILYLISFQHLHMFYISSLGVYPYFSPSLVTIYLKQPATFLFNSLENSEVYDVLSPTLPVANSSIL